MGNDISFQFTREQNKKCGRLGYCGATYEKITDISPAQYGMFVANKKKRSK